MTGPLGGVAVCASCGGGGGGGGSAAPALPTRIRISDLLSLAPASVALTAEPSTWGIVGSHTNFYTSASSQRVSGTLLGRSITAVFTPIAYRWSYGDGTTAETTTPGAAWVSLGQEEFTRTPTSHVYTSKATVVASVTVVYSAVVEIAGGPVIPVDGTIDRAATTVDLELFNADTVLTIGDCEKHPSQPAC